MKLGRLCFAIILGVLPAVVFSLGFAAERPHVILVMADDQGWGQTGYYGHPILKTPHLDAMAAAGLRLDRFYAGGPVCSPTRASVLTGRTHNRTGVISHGYALHRQEKTIAQALSRAGYSTGHFGKWHLNGIRGPGVPVLESDHYHPGHFGFDQWLTVTNYFDRNPLMSRNGEFEEFRGDSSEIIVGEALKFITRNVELGKPSFSVIWYGSPHSPWVASNKDKIVGEAMASANHHGELVAMDRSIGALRSGLKRLGIQRNTLVWFCSDNGGLKGVGHDSVGGLRGHKGSIWEGGLRVPGIIEWPAGIQPRVTSFTAGVVDIFPTLVELLKIPEDAMLDRIDGVSLVKLLEKETGLRSKPLGFVYQNKAALIHNDWKIVTEKMKSDQYVLYNLRTDPTESQDLMAGRPDLAESMQKQLEEFIQSVANSQKGNDYPDGKVTREGPHGRFWYDIDGYQPFLKGWSLRPEYKGWVARSKNRLNKTKAKKRLQEK